jgi:hypothetical protein
MTRQRFCAHLAPAASIALWILQHAPELAQRNVLHLLIAEAKEYDLLDFGRWLQFIPWMLGRPGMKLEATLACAALPQTATGEPGTDRACDFEHQMRSHSWNVVKLHSPAALHLGSLKSWLDAEQARRVGKDNADGLYRPDLCAVFTPTFSVNHATLLTDDGLLALLRLHVPLALFSPTEAEQLVDVYTLQASGLILRDADYWPNPWALPTSGPERIGTHAKFGWAAEFDAIPAVVHAEQSQMLALAKTLAYVSEAVAAGGDDAILSLGEPLRAAPATGAGTGASSLLLRLPGEVSVDADNGAVYQLQDSTALLLESIPRVPAESLQSLPGADAMLRRAMWAVDVHSRFVAPHVQKVDEALADQFSMLDLPETA